MGPPKLLGTRTVIYFVCMVSPDFDNKYSTFLEMLF